MLGLAWVMHQNSEGVQAGKESNMVNEQVRAAGVCMGDDDLQGQAVVEKHFCMTVEEQYYERNIEVEERSSICLYLVK